MFDVEKEIDSGNLRFIVVTKDRYKGVYSGHAYTAWNLGVPYYARNVKDPSLEWCFGAPNSVSGDDITCDEYWNGALANPELYPLFGGGSTQIEAVKDFAAKLEAITGISACVNISGIFYTDPYTDNRNDRVKFFKIASEDDFNQFDKAKEALPKLMVNNKKYIFFELDGVESIFIFTKNISHDRMADAVTTVRCGSDIHWVRPYSVAEVVAAGFVDNNVCHGYSESLKLKSRPEIDTKLLSIW